MLLAFVNFERYRDHHPSNLQLRQYGIPRCNMKNVALRDNMHYVSLMLK